LKLARYDQGGTANAPVLFHGPFVSANKDVEGLLSSPIIWAHHSSKKEAEVIPFVRKISLNVGYIHGTSRGGKV
jgi:hypothetical protein